MSARTSPDAVEAHPEVVTQADQTALRVTLDALSVCVIVREREVLDGGRLGRKLLRPLTDAPCVPVAHYVVLSNASCLGWASVRE